MVCCRKRGYVIRCVAYIPTAGLVLNGSFNMISRARRPKENANIFFFSVLFLKNSETRSVVVTNKRTTCVSSLHYIRILLYTFQYW